MALITVRNQGPLIVETNYWESEYAQTGKVVCSINAGTIRVLLPPSRYTDLPDMRQAQYCVLSRGPWRPEAFGNRFNATPSSEGIEIMWEDLSDSPYALHLTPESFDMLPAEPPPGREWNVSVWTLKDGKPHKEIEHICHWRQALSLPWMKPWTGLG